MFETTTGIHSLCTLTRSGSLIGGCDEYQPVLSIWWHQVFCSDSEELCNTCDNMQHAFVSVMKTKCVVVEEHSKYYAR